MSDERQEQNWVPAFAGMTATKDWGVAAKRDAKGADAAVIFDCCA
jgi:hypothetical protein